MPTRWLRLFLCLLHRAVIVAMAVAGVVQVACHQVVDVVAMRDRLVPAAVAVALIVLAAVMLWRAGGRLDRVPAGGSVLILVTNDCAETRRA
jgi:hypothetical protein